MSITSLFANPVIQPWLDKAPKYSLQVTPSSLVFVPEPDIITTPKQSVLITNKGYVDLQVDKIHAQQDYVFSPVGNSSVIKVGETLEVDVYLRPATEFPITESVLQIDFGCGVPLNVSVALTVVERPSP